MSDKHVLRQIKTVRRKFVRENTVRQGEHVEEVLGILEAKA